MKNYIKDNTLIIELEGKINSENVEDIDKEVRTLIKGTGLNYMFDADKLEYITSAGLRFLLKLKKEKKDELTIINVSPEVYEIFEMTGFATLLNVKKKLRVFSVEGCPVIGKGAMGTVYRIDMDTIIKVYDNVNDIHAIENEVNKAREAFLMGIPTAIPFDIVKVQDKYGAIFELIKSTNSNDYLIENTNELDGFCTRYADFIKDIHSVVDEKNSLPRIKDMYLSHLKTIKNILSPDLFEKIENVINEIPDEKSVIHGDVQVKNIMISDDDLVIIDMDTLSEGSPVFDFGGLFMTYVTFSIHEPDNTKKFLGLDADVTSELFYKTVKQYYRNLSDVEYQRTINIIKMLGFVRFLFLIYGLQIGAPELKDVRIKYSINALNELV